MSKIRGKLDRKRYLNIRQNLNLVRFNDRYVNHIRLDKRRKRGKELSQKHWAKICEICMWLLENDYDFITEATFLKRGRADIFVLDTGDAYEVLSSEKMKDFNKKNYPVPTYPIRINEKWRGL